MKNYINNIKFLEDVLYVIYDEIIILMIQIEDMFGTESIAIEKLINGSI